MRVWIDLSNSPHPLLFAPIARALQERGHEVGVTVRDNAQTVELALARWPDATILGGQSPKSRVSKALAMGDRVRTLTRWGRSFAGEVALSHNSYGQILAARALGLRVVTAMDYEGQPANHLAFRLADTVLLPAALRGGPVVRQGATTARTHFYEGYKEQLYLGDFQPDASVLSAMGLAQVSEHRLVVLRAPPSRATYHQFANPIFEELLALLGRDAGIRCVALVRHPEQRAAILAKELTNVIVPERAVDSRSLLYHADLFIGAGGTMTREAALMGIPTYSVFAGASAAVDRELEREGRLQRLSHIEELGAVVKRTQSPSSVAELRAGADRLIETFVKAVEAQNSE